MSFRKCRTLKLGHFFPCTPVPMHPPLDSPVEDPDSRTIPNPCQGEACRPIVRHQMFHAAGVTLGTKHPPQNIGHAGSVYLYVTTNVRFYITWHGTLTVHKPTTNRSISRASPKQLWVRREGCRVGMWDARI